MQYDPRTKQDIKDALYTAIYGKVRERFRHQLEDIIRKNSALHKNGQEYMRHNGSEYSIAGASLRKPKPMNRTHPDLVEAMDEWEQQLNDLNNRELPYVLGYLNQVLNSSNGFEDYYRLLPQALHATLDRIKKDCPCVNAEINQDVLEEILQKNQTAVGLIQQRILTNLITGV